MTPKQSKLDLVCPLCDGKNLEELPPQNSRPFFQCKACALIFVPHRAHLDFDAEKQRYLQHQNDPGDLEYRRFLSRLADPLLQRLPKGLKGLDFGSGPGPALAPMLSEAGMSMQNYDPFFAPAEQVFQETFHFITATETLEHLCRPGYELDRLARLLHPGGLLAVMTEMWDASRNFSDWHYHRDPTHIAFFQKKTMKFIAKRWGWELEFPHKNVTFFFKP